MRTMVASRRLRSGVGSMPDAAVAAACTRCRRAFACWIAARYASADDARSPLGSTYMPALTYAAFASAIALWTKPTDSSSVTADARSVSIAAMLSRPSRTSCASTRNSSHVPHSVDGPSALTAPAGSVLAPPTPQKSAFLSKSASPALTDARADREWRAPPNSARGFTTEPRPRSPPSRPSPAPKKIVVGSSQSICEARPFCEARPARSA